MHFPIAIKMVLILRKPLSMKSITKFLSTKYVLASGTLILGIQLGCQRGSLQTKKKTEVPIKSRAIIWHNCKYISSGLPCWWVYEPETRRHKTKRDKHQESPNQKRQGEKSKIKRGTERKAEMVSRKKSRERDRETSRINNKDTKKRVQERHRESHVSTRNFLALHD